jgi:hypothetical protein
VEAEVDRPVHQFEGDSAFAGGQSTGVLLENEDDPVSKCQCDPDGGDQDDDPFLVAERFEHPPIHDKREPDGRDPRGDDAGHDRQGGGNDVDSQIGGKNAPPGSDEEKTRKSLFPEAGDEVGDRPASERARGDVIAVGEVCEVQDAVGHREPDTREPDNQSHGQPIEHIAAELRDEEFTGTQISHKVNEKGCNTDPEQDCKRLSDQHRSASFEHRRKFVH